MSFEKKYYDSYDNNLCCDICDSPIGYMEEYMFINYGEKNICSESCLEKFIEDFIDDNIMYCENC